MRGYRVVLIQLVRCVRKRILRFDRCLSITDVVILIGVFVNAICVEISDDWESGYYKYMCAIKDL